MLTLIFEIIILAFLIFLFVFMLNLIRRMITELPQTIHEQMIKEIQEILQDKPLYDNLNSYAKQIANNVMQGVKPNVKTKDLIPMIAGTVLQKFIPNAGQGGGIGGLMGGLGNIQAQNPQSANKPAESSNNGNAFDK